jgi:DNA-binding PadR family transcriptional regulator
VRGLVSPEWGVSSNNRRAKYYHLTATGLKALKEDSKYWSRLSGAISLIMEGA